MSEPKIVYNNNFDKQSKEIDDIIEILNIVREGLNTKSHEIYYKYVQRLIKYNEVSSNMLEKELEQFKIEDSSEDETYLDKGDKYDSVSEYSEDASGEDDIVDADNRAYKITELARRNIQMDYEKVF